MKFRTYLESIPGIEIFPLISLLIFFIFFVSLIIFVFSLDKKAIRQMSNIPLNDGVIKKALPSVALFFIVSSSAFAQEKTEHIWSVSGTEILLCVLLAILFFMAVMIVIVLFKALSVLKQFSKTSEQQDSKAVFSDQWWKKFRGIGVSLTDEKEILIDGHDYDGIQELDNRMPPWLQSLFIASIGIALFYAVYYFSGIGDLQIAELDKEIAIAEMEKKAYIEKAGASMDENTVTQLTEETVLSQGKAIFTEKCTACHGADGGGAVGPNLTDDYWLHGGGIKNLFKVVKYGVPEKGMISWEKQLSPTDIQKVASYVLSLKGTKPANPKEPQGELLADGSVAIK
ncbi:c-type cytochrome [Dyadobacter sp. NIV53]|uniref:c-type cytochrome n=1 Tax=Dyadobacter sp. NIV53 TaxID=2861765 RepID=UPI001C86CB6B|nr:c-type cytochrome [Dyadobacter sp. NIV53]